MWYLADIEGWWVTLIPEVLKILGILALALLVMLFTWLKKKLKLNEGERQGLDAIADGIQFAYDEFVTQTKASAKDGKLTKDEIATARTMAKNKALELAKGPGLTFLEALAKERWNRLISWLVEKMKPKED